MSMTQKPFPHGIDITKPGGIEKLIAHHRTFWGDMQMNANAGDGGDAGSEGGESGGAGGGEAGAAAGSTDAGGAGAASGGDLAGDAGAAGAGGQTNPWGEDFDAEKAWKLVQNVRSDLQAEKGKRDQAIQDAVAKAINDTKSSFTQDIAKALGLVEDTPDPAKLLETVTAERDTLTGERDTWKNTALENQIKLGVFSAATANNADPTKLLDSMSFMDKVKKFDPVSDDFATQVAEVVKGAVEADKSLRVQAAAPRGGGDFSGGNNGGGTQLTREDLAKMTPAEILQANKEGRLKTLATPPGN